MGRRATPGLSAGGALAGLLASPRVGGACFFTGKRDYCAGTAVLLRGSVPLCQPCADRASSLTRAPVRHLPAVEVMPATVPKVAPWPTRRAKSPLESLEALRRVRAGLPRREAAAVRVARRSGMSWAEVGAGLGMSAQAAHERFRPYVP